MSNGDLWPEQPVQKKPAVSDFTTVLDEYKCDACGITQPLSNYHKSPRKIGHVRKCKTCMAMYHTEWYEKNKALKLEQNEYYRQKHADDINKKHNARRDPVKDKARHAVNNAIVLENMTKEPCAQCGNKVVDFHHTAGYEQENWFTGIWLCRPCHATVHKEARRKALAAKLGQTL